MSETNRERRNRIKQELLLKRGGKCIKCGYSKSPSALCFHHRNPKTKKFNVSGTNLTRIARKKVEAEVRNCVVYCLNCHAEAHDEEGWVHEEGKRTPRAKKSKPSKSR